MWGHPMPPPLPLAASLPMVSPGRFQGWGRAPGIACLLAPSCSGSQHVCGAPPKYPPCLWAIPRARHAQHLSGPSGGSRGHCDARLERSHSWVCVRVQGGDRLRQLEALHLPGVQVADDVAAHLAQCTALEELSVGEWASLGASGILRSVGGCSSGGARAACTHCLPASGLRVLPRHTCVQRCNLLPPSLFLRLSRSGLDGARQHAAGLERAAHAAHAQPALHLPPRGR